MKTTNNNIPSKVEFLSTPRERPLDTVGKCPFVVVAALCAVILSSCATQSPAERAAELEKYRAELAASQARFNRLTPEEKLAKLQTAVTMGNALQQAMADARAEREIRALERMAQPNNYWIFSNGGGNYTVMPSGY
jgi:type II secretory pathway component PulM